MSTVRNKNTKPEVIIKSMLCQLGYRKYRLRTTQLNCKPDIVFVKNKKAIFVNGCFWHGHICKKAHLPETNYDFWKEKVETNKKRDARNYKELKEKGWKYLVIWECELKKRDREKLIARVLSFMEDEV